MAAIISFQEWKKEKGILEDLGEDPCSLCGTREGCCTTCMKATIWWNKVADRLNIE